MKNIIAETTRITTKAFHPEQACCKLLAKNEMSTLHSRKTFFTNKSIETITIMMLAIIFALDTEKSNGPIMFQKLIIWIGI